MITVRFLLGMGLAWLSASSVRGEDPTLKVHSKNIREVSGSVAGQIKRIRGLPILDQLRTANEVLRFADELTWNPNVKADITTGEIIRKPIVLFGVKDVTLSHRAANTVLGYEVPGSSISTTLRVDCEIRAEYDPNEVQIAALKSRPRAVEFRIPKFKNLVPDFAPDAVADYKHDLGSLRSSWMSETRSKEIRNLLYALAKDKAKDVVQDYLDQHEQEIGQQIATELRSQFPEFVVESSANPEGYVIVLDRFFSELAETVPSDQGVTSPSQQHPEYIIVAITIGIVVFVVVLLFIIRRRSKQEKS